MGIKIVVKDADFAYTALSYDPPVPQGLKYLNFFGTDKRTLSRNLAPNMPQARMEGEPALTKDAAQFKYLERFVRTGVKQTPDCTLLCVVSVPPTQPPVWRHLISNYGRDNNTGGLKIGYSLALKLDSPDVRGLIGLLSTSGAAAKTSGSVRPITLGSTILAVTRIDSAARGVGTINRSANSATTATYDAGYTPELNGEFLIGGAAGLLVGGDADVSISFAAIYDRALSDAEITKIYASLKTFYAARGITI